MNQPKNKIGLLLYLVSKAHHNRASQTFEKIGLCRGQPPVLFELGCQDGITQSELAEKLEVTPATMTNMLRRIEAAGYIERIRDAADTRISRVFLTDAGKNAVTQARELADRMDQFTFAGFSAEEMNTMLEYFERIHTNLTQATPTDMNCNTPI